MTTTVPQNSKISNAGASVPNRKVTRDQMLVDIRSGRRLARIVASIENFLKIQVERVEETIAQCEAAVQNDIRIQQRLAEFEKEKREWDETRKTEIARLSSASDELAKAWEQLESERRQLIESKT